MDVWDARPFTPRDWIEDYADTDNGCYAHLCPNCGESYAGHKHRVGECKSCWIEFATQCVIEHNQRKFNITQPIVPVEEA